ncbi:MAG: cobalt-precorrin-5B (C(1))-methyltransferase CbiD [Syntrophales bacterium]|nr:cobalt-precorrin-5B (C(1))-methyltransferase CbiD [Syntrophales bacterium]MDD5233889.1 cobalt-precorrin-5B (C(1))-methyltransferase CbiD [Syntrophales bacterium]
MADRKALKEGFTTGTCAAAASRAAVLLLDGKASPAEVEIGLPGGERARIGIEFARKGAGFAEAGVRKYAGDDPDVTDGAVVVARAAWAEGADVCFAAGEGVGTVTLPGLQVPPGEPAINPTPRKMIRDAVRSVTDRGVLVTLSIPGGRELAEKTFNRRLGIEGGLSILGTSGKVRPFSCPALKASLQCLLDVADASGVADPVLVPGRIGERAARRHFRTGRGQVIEVSNEWGFMLDLASRKRFKAMLLLGHPGKMAKLAMGQWDTHSARSRSAVSFVGALAEAHGTPRRKWNTVDAVFSALVPPAREEIGNSLAALIAEKAGEKTGGNIAIAAVLVDMEGGWIGSKGDLTPWK